MYSPAASTVLATRRTAYHFFGPWLFRDVTLYLQVAGALATRAFRELATSYHPRGREDDTNFGTHRGAAVAALLHAGVLRPLVTQALRHASAWSDESYNHETMYGSS